MSFKAFNPTNCASMRSSRPQISINQKSGLVSINKEAGAMLKLQEGESVQFFQSETEEEEWYLAKMKDGFSLRTKKNVGGFCFNNTAVCKAICASVNYVEPSGILPVLKEGVTIAKGVIGYPVMVVNLKNK